MANQVNYYKVVSLPTSLQPSSFYFAKGVADSGFKMYLTSDSATPIAIELDAVTTKRLVSAGAGLSGGGDLTADRTLSIDENWFNTRYGRLGTANTWTAKNDFTAALGIPSIAPASPTNGVTYLHFGAIGTGGETPPLVANLTDLQDVDITAVDQSTDGVVSWSASLGKFILGNSITGYIPLSQKGTANGVATLGADGKLVSSQLPSLVIVDTFTVASQAAMLALSTAEQGDVAIRTDENKSYILVGGSPSVLANWEWLRTPSVANTDQVPEGTSNLYFTTARARASLSAGTGISYASGTGVISLNRGTVDTWYEPVFSKNTAFNKNFGTAAGTVAEGNDSRFAPQTLSLGTTAGSINISGGNSVGLYNLNLLYTSELNTDYGVGFHALNIASGVAYPLEFGGGVRYQRQAGRSAGDFEIWKANGASSKLMFNRAISESAWIGWQTFASEEWVTARNYSQLASDNTFTAHNHFDAAISIPSIAPTTPHANKTYLHFGALGSGGTQPPLVANLSDLQDVTITGATSGQVLQWNGSKWVNGTVPLDLSGYVQKSTQVIAGTGLTGGGSLTTDRTLSVNFGTAANTVAMGNHTHTFASLTAKPTTLLGYGITDAVSLTGYNKANWDTAFGWGNHASAGYAKLAGIETFTGKKTFSAGLASTIDAATGNDVPRLSQVTTLITNATSWSQEAW